MDVTHIDCGADGWANLAAVIDCHEGPGQPPFLLLERRLVALRASA